MKPRKDFNGVEFNSMTVVHDIPSTSGIRKVMCKCKCGVVKPVSLAKLKNGSTKSCGSCTFSPNYKHGMKDTRFYHVWENMIQRTKDDQNKDYGGRGITVCDSWKTFSNFKDDMLEGYAEHLSIERKNVNGNYNKENCTWETLTVQGHNRRKHRGNCKSYGVSWSDRDKMYIAAIAYNKVSCRVYFKTEDDAAKGYDDASQVLYGDRPNGTLPKEDTTLQRITNKLKYRGMM